jgi:hypothetical protein
VKTLDATIMPGEAGSVILQCNGGEVPVGFYSGLYSGTYVYLRMVRSGLVFAPGANVYRGEGFFYNEGPAPLIVRGILSCAPPLP